MPKYAIATGGSNPSRLAKATNYQEGRKKARILSMEYYRTVLYREDGKAMCAFDMGQEVPLNKPLE